MLQFIKKYYWFYFLKSKVKSIRPNSQSLAFYKSFIDIQGKIVFDVGANIGLRTSIFKELGALVLSIDANSEMCKELKNRFGDSILIENVGVAKQPGILKLTKASSSTISTFKKEFLENVRSGIFKEYSFEKFQLSRVTSLDKLMDLYGMPQLIKIDVEGFEVEVLQGLSTPIKCIQFEYMFNYDLGWDYFYECIHELKRLSPKYKFNFTRAESYTFVNNRFYNLDEFLNQMNAEFKNNKSWGDVICLHEN